MVGAGVAVRRTPSPRAKEEPQEDGRKGEIKFRIKPHIVETPRGLKQNFMSTWTQGSHKRLIQTCF